MMNLKGKLINRQAPLTLPCAFDISAYKAFVQCAGSSYIASIYMFFFLFSLHVLKYLVT